MNSENRFALVEITNSCNLKCRHCYNERFSQPDLSLNQIKLILNKLSSFGFEELILTGGEPLIRKDLFEIIDYSTERGIKDIIIYTNGISLSNSQIVECIQNRLDVIRGLIVSFDGAREDTHDFIRGTGKFNHLLRTLQGEKLAEIPIGMNVTIGNWNFNDFDQFFRIYDQINASGINFGIFLPLGAGKILKDQLLSPEKCLFLIQKSKLKQEEGYNIELCSLPWSKRIDDNLSGSCCNIFTDFLTISAKGDVIPCLLYEYSIGSILTMELEEIFEHQLAKILCSPTYEMQKITTGACNSCPTFEQCRGGCKMLAHAVNDHIFSSDKSCIFGKFH